MNIVDFFKEKVEGYNTEKKCGYCWSFHYGRGDYTNLLKKKNCNCDCCVTFLLEKYVPTTIYKVDDSDGYSEKFYTDYNFELFVGVDSDFTRQLYKEVEGCKVSEGKYERYLKPLETCLQDVFDVDLCAGINPAAITRIAMYEKLNYKDQNYDGYFIKGILRKWWM